LSDNNESEPAPALPRGTMRAIGRELRAIYAEIIAESVPEQFAEILRRLDDFYARSQDRISTTRKWFKDYMRSIGFIWVPCMTIGSGCKVHLADGELPMGRLVVNVSRHSVAVIDGAIHDTHDPTRDGNRCVYGFWKLKPGWWAGLNRRAMRAWAEQTTHEHLKATHAWTGDKMRSARLATGYSSTWNGDRR
jgi:hypothetical protein